MQSQDSTIIVDSNLSFEQAVANTKAPKEILDSLVLIDVLYYSFDGKLHKGQLVVNSTLAKEVSEIFEFIREIKYPVEKVIPILKYDWSDMRSMEDNNTSCFNYRNIEGTNRLSLHSFGRAIDINPLINPVVYPDGRTVPSQKGYNPKREGTLTENHPLVREFLRRGWRWGGHFTKYKDYHHFDKP